MPDDMAGTGPLSTQRTQFAFKTMDANISIDVCICHVYLSLPFEMLVLSKTSKPPPCFRPSLSKKLFPVRRVTAKKSQSGGRDFFFLFLIFH